jgi:hypothetical protein
MTDLLTVTRRKLPDWEEFLEAWIKFLRPKKEKEADQLLREAVRLQGGATSLADLARREGTKRPRAYLDWVAFLVEEKQYREALEAAQEALDQLPSHLPLRAAIADHLCAAARKLKLTDKEQQGRWEAFAAWPSLPRLLDLREVTPPGHRPQILTRAATHLEKYLKKEERRSNRIRDLEEDFGNERGYISPLVLGHAYLLNRDWEKARALADCQGPLGWTYSDNPQRLVMPAFLVLILGPKTTLPTFVNDLWKRALDPDHLSFLSSEEKREPRRLKEAYEELRKQTQLTEAEEKALLTWCLKTAQRRAEAIVKGQHRRSYDKAAAVLAACVEACRARQEEAQGNALIRKLRERFPRHRAFQQELNRAMGKIGVPG